MRGTVSTACLTLQAMVRDVWASGSTIAAICQATGVTKDQLIRLRKVLELPARHDRSQRAKPPRERDPTPREIAKRSAEIRAKWDERTEQLRCHYKVQQFNVPVIRLEDSGLPPEFRDKLGGVSDLLEDG